MPRTQTKDIIVWKTTPLWHIHIFRPINIHAYIQSFILAKSIHTKLHTCIHNYIHFMQTYIHTYVPINMHINTHTTYSYLLSGRVGTSPAFPGTFIQGRSLLISSPVWRGWGRSYKAPCLSPALHEGQHFGLGPSLGIHDYTCSCLMTT